MKKLTPEQLQRYKEIQERKSKKKQIEVNEIRRKNLQAWIPFELWVTVKSEVARIGTSMNKYVEEALATYLLLDEEDIRNIMEKHK